MALLTGLLIGLGRLSADREAVALLACGVSPYRLLRPILLMAGLAAAVTMYVMIKAIPDANQTFREITFEVIAKKVENDIHPRVFFSEFPGWVLYVSDEPRDAIGGWKDVLVANTSKPDSTELYLSARGRLVLNRQERRVDLVLTDGARYSTGKPGETQTYRFPGDLTMALNPEEVSRQSRPAQGADRKDDRRAAARHGDQAHRPSGLFAAPRNHPDRAEVLSPVCVRGVRNHRPGAWALGCPRRQDGWVRGNKHKPTHPAVAGNRRDPSARRIIANTTQVTV